MHFGQGTFSGLHQRNAVLSILLSNVEARDLSTHLLGNGQTGGVVACAVDLVAGRQLLKVLGQCAGVVGVVAVGVHRHNVVLDSHTSYLLFSNPRTGSFPSGLFLFNQEKAASPLLLESTDTAAASPARAGSFLRRNRFSLRDGGVHLSLLIWT